MWVFWFLGDFFGEGGRVGGGDFVFFVVVLCEFFCFVFGVFCLCCFLFVFMQVA